MSGDHCARLKCLDRVERGNSLGACLRIGVVEIQMGPVVRGITHHDKAD